MVRNNEKERFLGYRQYVIAGLLIALAAVGTTALYSSRQEKEREQMEAELAEEMQKQADDIAAEESSSSLPRHLHWFLQNSL